MDQQLGATLLPGEGIPSKPSVKGTLKASQGVVKVVEALPLVVGPGQLDCTQSVYWVLASKPEKAWESDAVVPEETMLPEAQLLP